MIVADTCLIFHLFNETALTEKAQRILEKDPNWIMPPLWREEYANVLSKLARKESRAVDEVIHLFKVTSDELSSCEIDVETVDALEIALEYKISVYDAHFVVLSKRFDVILLTEDKEILKKCSKFSLNLGDFLKGC